MFPDLVCLWKNFRDATRILIDIPFGLPENFGLRQCDVDARKSLGPKKGTVFSVPCREAIHASTYTYANVITMIKCGGKKIPPVSWALIPKILDLENLFVTCKFDENQVREIHPELCFWALNGASAMKHKKSTVDGQKERIEVLNKFYLLHTEELYDAALKKYERKDVDEDDILDALAGAVTAYTAYMEKTELISIPAVPEKDSLGLRMEMVYVLPHRG